MCHKRFLVALTLFVATWLGGLGGASAAAPARVPARTIVKTSVVARPMVAAAHAHTAQLSADAAVASDHFQDDGVDIDDDDTQDIVCGLAPDGSVSIDPRQRITEQTDQEHQRARWPAIAARGPPHI